jgi:hypothetical protein
MNIAPYYVAISDFGQLGLGHACDPTDFDGACDAFAEKMDAGYETQVFRVDPPKGTAAGAMIDVTDDALHRIAVRLRQRGHDDWPVWLEAAA